jgi:hypothetical protein
VDIDWAGGVILSTAQVVLSLELRAATALGRTPNKRGGLFSKTRYPRADLAEI